MGFEEPSDIQSQAIPHLIEGRSDFIGLAQTGTGKTAAFGLPLLERLDPSDPATQALILAPTRELGQQIAEQLQSFGKLLPKLNILAVYGGAAIVNQMKALKQPQHIIIATPGRLIDLIGRKAVSLEQLQILVLDEADEMLNMGFKDELDEILRFTPRDKMTWLFSATMPKAIRKMVEAYMHEPIEVRVNAQQEVNVNITHQFAVLKQDQKPDALMRFMDLDPDMRGVVFCRTKRDTQNLAEQLLKLGYQADALHGDLSQPQRDRVMKRFKNHELKVLIATDVAARGIDVNDLTHVFHMALPDDPSYYTHRSGRTARAGKKGISLALVNSREKGRLFGMEKKLGIQFEKAKIPEAKQIAASRLELWAQQIINQPIKNRLPAGAVEQMEVLLAALSREELLAKMAALHLHQQNLDWQAEDLNQAPGAFPKSNRSKYGKAKGKPKPGNKSQRRFKERFKAKKNQKGGRFK
jgi:ATP-dependent RNA helicase DeaD